MPPPGTHPGRYIWIESSIGTIFARATFKFIQRALVSAGEVALARSLVHWRVAPEHPSGEV